MAKIHSPLEILPSMMVRAAGLATLATADEGSKEGFRLFPLQLLLPDVLLRTFKFQL